MRHIKADSNSYGDYNTSNPQSLGTKVAPLEPKLDPRDTAEYKTHQKEDSSNLNKTVKIVSNNKRTLNQSVASGGSKVTQARRDR